MKNSAMKHSRRARSAGCTVWLAITLKARVPWILMPMDHSRYTLTLWSPAIIMMRSSRYARQQTPRSSCVFPR